MQVIFAPDCREAFERAGLDYPEREPERSTWSAYFEDGKEWWGIWCFTVWNPRRGTLAAVMASTTD